MEAMRGSGKLKIFISYSRRDAAAADAVVDSLVARGFEVNIDRRDLPFGEKWQAELAEFIRLSDTVVWLVSEASIGSKWVNWELDEVAKRNKRLVPVMIAETTRDLLPRQLGEIHILPAEGVFNCPRDLDALVAVLETDRTWLKQASRLQDRAVEWLSKARTSALLLSRAALSDAERWKSSRPAKAPAPAQEVLDLMLASRQAVTRRQRWWLAGSVAVATGAVALAGVAYLQSLEAEKQRVSAQANEIRAIEQERFAIDERDAARRQEAAALEQRNLALVSESRLLTVIALREARGGRLAEAALIAMEALPRFETPEFDRPIVQAAVNGFKSVANQISTKTIVPNQFGLELEDISIVSENLLLIRSSDTIELIDVEKVEAVASHKVDNGVLGLNATTKIVKPTALGSNKMRTLHFAAYEDGVIRFFRIYDSKITEITDKRIETGLRGIRSIAAALNGQIIVATEKGVIATFDVAKRKLVQSFQASKGAIFGLALNPNLETEVVIASEEGLARIVDLNSKKTKYELVNGESEEVFSAAYSADGQYVATSDWGAFVDVWRARDGRLLSHIRPCNRVSETTDEKRGALRVAFDVTGRYVIISLMDNTLRVWEWQRAEEVAVLSGHNNAAPAVAVPIDGRSIVSAGRDGLVHVWPFTDSIELYLANGIDYFKYSRSTDQGQLIVDCERTARADKILSATEMLSDEASLKTALQQLVKLVRSKARVCLSIEQRQRLSLTRNPPRWCLTGTGLEDEPDPTKWLPNAPYDKGGWRQWLAARDKGENPPFPHDQSKKE